MVEKPIASVPPREIVRAAVDDDTQAIADELAAARAAAGRQARASHAPATLALYERDWVEFDAWCTRMSAVDDDIRALPTSDATLAAWMGALDHLAPSTRRRKLAAVRYTHERLGYPLLTVELPATVAAMRGHRRERRSTPLRQQTAATDAIIRQLADTCDVTTLIGLRNRALLLLGWDGAFRRGELVGIDVEHVDTRPAGLAIRLPWAKADQSGEGATVSILARTASRYCPVDAVDAWSDAGHRVRGPLFVSLQRSKHVKEGGVQRLAPKAVERVIKQAARRAGLTENYAGHSLRRGLVTTAVDAGVPLEQVMRHARHQSIQTTLGYAETRTAEAAHPHVGLDVIGAPPVDDPASDRGIGVSPAPRDTPPDSDLDNGIRRTVSGELTPPACDATHRARHGTS